MSTKDRRERHKIATREAILTTALDIAREDGWAAVTIRRVAEMIEYTPPIIYEYFANKAALLDELQDRGFEQMAEQINHEISAMTDSRERLLGVGSAYIKFAYTQPELYQLMHGWNSADVDLEKTLTRATRAAEIAEKCLTNWAVNNKLDMPDPEGDLEIAWALLHGLVSVEMMGRIRGGQDRVEALALKAMEGLLFAWAR